MSAWSWRLWGPWRLNLAPGASWLRISQGIAPPAGQVFYRWWRVGPIRLRRFIPAAEVVRWRPPAPRPPGSPEQLQRFAALVVWLEARTHYGLGVPSGTDLTDTATTNPRRS